LPIGQQSELRMESLKNLATVVCVAQTGSFTAAGRQLGLSTPAVSKIVARLEQELDTRLFNRTTRQLSLTSQGQVFLERAGIALRELEGAVDALHEARSEASGLIRIVSNVAIGKEVILPLLARFMSRYPKVSVEMRFDDGVPDLVREGFDIGIHHLEVGEQSYVSRLLGVLPLALVASPEYLSRRGVPRTPADLAAHDAVSVRQNSGQPAVWEFKARAARRGRGAEVYRHEPAARLLVAEQYDAVVNGALLGMGITVVFAHTVLRHLRAGDLRVLLPEYEVRGTGVEGNRIQLRYPHRRHLPFSVRLLVDFLVEHFRDEENLRFDAQAYAVREPRSRSRARS
jgi:DNA-binding transcriptional LysR family regulator